MGVIEFVCRNQYQRRGAWASYITVVIIVPDGFSLHNSIIQVYRYLAMLNYNNICPIQTWEQPKNLNPGLGGVKGILLPDWSKPPST